MVLAVFVATVLIAQLCGTSIPSCLIGAALGTIIYEAITGFKSPRFISSCGATVSAVVGALALGGSNNYVAVAIGGVIIAVVYILFALLIKCGGRKLFDRIFPPIVVGPVTMVIGLNLVSFIPGYLGFTDPTTGALLTKDAFAAAVQTQMIPRLVALFTLLITAFVSHYGKGFLKTLSFLVGLISGFILAVVLEFSHAYDFDIASHYTNIKWFNPDDFAFMRWKDSPFSWDQLPSILILFIPVSICAALEHYSDHKTLSNILGTDLTVNPGLDRTLIGDGVASAVGAAVGGLPNTSYGESIATIGFSKVGSVWITLVAALIVGVLGFLAPVTAFISSIPSAVFAGCAFILYGYIAESGLKTLFNSHVDLADNRNLIIISVILTSGVSGVALFSASFKGTSLAMVLGVLLNLILKPSKNKVSQ